MNKVWEHYMVIGITILIILVILLCLEYTFNYEPAHKLVTMYPGEVPCNCDSLSVKYTNNLVAYTPYKRGKKNGVTRMYFNEVLCSYELRSEILYIDDIKQSEKRYVGSWDGLVLIHYIPSISGIEMQYYFTGELKFEVEISDGHRNGIGKWYHGNGKVSGTATYEKGEMIGYKKCTNGKIGNEYLKCEE